MERGEGRELAIKTSTLRRISFPSSFHCIVAFGTSWIGFDGSQPCGFVYSSFIDIDAESGKCDIFGPLRSDRMERGVSSQRINDTK
jgi:hypothetical protein